MTAPALTTADVIIKFWFEAGPKKWWIKNKKFDQTIIDRFGATHEAACAGKLDDWAHDAQGALALIIVLDQFSRNMFRGDPKTYAQDNRARAIAKDAIDKGFDQKFPIEQRSFFYLPFMHAEDLALQNYCVALYRAAGNKKNLPHALEHAEIIRRFGRFPHRNQILGRTSSPAELAFLEAGGFAG